MGIGKRSKRCQDWYFMAYGHDYKAALKDFSNLPEILKKQPRINEEDIEWFLTHCGYNL